MKRPLPGNPASLDSSPAFRGKEHAGSAIKAPRIQAGNRVDRGTNVTVPYEGHSLTSRLDNGQLVGDVAFVRRTPGGYVGASMGRVESARRADGDMFGIDGVNRMLAAH